MMTALTFCMLVFFGELIFNFISTRCSSGQAQKHKAKERDQNDAWDGGIIKLFYNSEILPGANHIDFCHGATLVIF
jgi:hypothetical protein